jgi:hypothetical protein
MLCQFEIESARKRIMGRIEENGLLAALHGRPTPFNI